MCGLVDVGGLGMMMRTLTLLTTVYFEKIFILNIRGN